METKEPKAPRTLWAYAYEMVPPRSSDYMREIQTLLEEEHSRARHGASMWNGQLVSEHQITHILVVSDSPDQGGEANRRLEGRLKEMHTRFSRTLPMVVPDDDGLTSEAIRQPSG